MSKRQSTSVLDRVDPRWLETARSVIKGLEKSSRPVRGLMLMEIEERVVKEYGPGVVSIPKQTKGYALLKELSRGTNAFDGSTKGKRSIANRPQGVFGRLRATRPGEYIVLDTNSLDVFAMEPVTCRWVQCELTVAMDLYSKVITGLRLTPVSTKSTDVAGVLFETVRPREVSTGTGEPLPYCGVPSTVLFDAEKLVDADGQPLLPPVAAETIIYDHGKIYVSNHIASVAHPGLGACAGFDHDASTRRSADATAGGRTLPSGSSDCAGTWHDYCWAPTPAPPRAHPPGTWPSATGSIPTCMNSYASRQPQTWKPTASTSPCPGNPHHLGSRIPAFRPAPRRSTAAGSRSMPRTDQSPPNSPACSA
ncbi:hypothetical protein [Streptomyces sp. CAS3]